MTFGEHLDELRTRIILALVGVVIATIICFIWTKDLLGYVIRPVYLVLRKYNQEPSLQSLSPPDTFLIYIKIAILCGLILSSPWVLYQVWMFVASGLFEKERKFVRRFGVASPLLFAGGVSFMFYIVLPIVLSFFAGFNRGFELPDWAPNWLEQRLIGNPEQPEEVAAPYELIIPILHGDPQNPKPGSVWLNTDSGKLRVAADGTIYQTQMRSKQNVSAITTQYSIDFYVSFILRLSLAFGVAFQLPIVVIFLVLSGLVPVHAMAKARGYVILGIVTGAAILTPPDVVSQIMLAIPMVILYETGLIIARVMLKRSEG